ncbi:hypothetical protein [Streptomyces cinereoruber]|uniref:hypothetical protein n=1 Tax=Streptomyces cinereoruber TaxID=67260 RepID=UPI0036383E0C
MHRTRRRGLPDPDPPDSPWALCWGVVTEAYYRETNPVLASVAHRTHVEALADFP